MTTISPIVPYHLIALLIIHASYSVGKSLTDGKHLTVARFIAVPPTGQRKLSVQHTGSTVAPQAQRLSEEELQLS